MAFRIGINVGDVLTEDGRLYGDGVNIAARLGGLSRGRGHLYFGSRVYPGQEQAGAEL